MSEENKLEQEMCNEKICNEEVKVEEKEDLEKKYDELKNEYLRTHADFENVKKRLEREKFTSLEYANEQFARDLLPILDALESAKLAAKDTPGILEGINLVLENFSKMLAKHDVLEIQSTGEFDPNVHECIMQVESQDLESGAIANVLQKGYMLKERVLRPSMVSVVK